MRPKLWNGADAVGEAATRGNALIDTPYQTHSGQGFRADKKPGLDEVFLSLPEEVEEDEDSWISLSSAFFDGRVHVVSGGDLRRTFRRRLTTTSSTSGWGWSVPTLTPDSSGKGYFFTQAPFSPPFAHLTMNLLGRFGRSVVPQYTVASWAGSIEYSLGFSPPIFSGVMFHANGADCHVRSENWASMDGVVYRNCLLLMANIKSDAGWIEYELVAPDVIDHADVGIADMCCLNPGEIAMVVCEHPGLHPSVFRGKLLEGVWAKAPNTLAAAFPNEVPYNNTYWPTEADCAAANPTITDPNGIRTAFLMQETIRRRINARGSETNAYALDANHIVYIAGPYPCSAQATIVGFSVSVINVNTGDVTNILHRQFNTNLRDYDYYLVMLGKDSWFVEFWSDQRNSPGNVYPVVEEALITFDRGVTYASVTLPSEYVPQTVGVFRPAGMSPVGTPDNFLAVCQVLEGGDRRIYKTVDFVTFTRGGLLAKAELIDHYMDFLTVKKLGTRKDKGYINQIFPWANDTRVQAPDWW